MKQVNEFCFQEQGGMLEPILVLHKEVTFPAGERGSVQVLHKALPLTVRRAGASGVLISFTVLQAFIFFFVYLFIF